MKEKLLLVLLLLGALIVPGTSSGTARTGNAKEGVVTIANGATVSTTIDLEDKCLVGIQYATLTGTTLTAQCSVDEVTFVTLFDAAGTPAAWSLTVADDQYHDLTIEGQAICGCRYLRLVSGSAEGAARTLQLQLAR